MRLIVPVLCGSALDHIGIQPLLDAVAYYLPSPADGPPVEGVDPEEARRQGNPQARARRAVLRPGVQDRRRQARRLALRARLLRRAQGQQPRAQPGQGQEGKRAAALAHSGRPPRAGAERSSAGDIVGIIGLRHSVTGDTLCDAQQPILLETIEFPETVISMAIEPETLDRAQEAGRRAGDDEAAGPDVPRPGERRDRPDADQRHGRAAPGSDQAPPAARFQPRTCACTSRASATAKRSSARPKSSATCHRQQGGQIAVRRGDDSHRALSAGRRRRRGRAGPRRRAARAVSVDRDRRADRAGARRRIARLPADAA